MTELLEKQVGDANNATPETPPESTEKPVWATCRHDFRIDGAMLLAHRDTVVRCLGQCKELFRAYFFSPDTNGSKRSGFTVETYQTFEMWQAAKRAAREGKAEANGKSDSPPKPIGNPLKGLPGTKMLSLTPQFGIEKKVGCSCENTARTMDKLGVEGCRRRANMLIMEIEAEWDKWEWKDKLTAAPKAMWKSLGLGIRPTDPVVDLFNLAVDLAEIEAKALAEAAQDATAASH